MKIDNKKQKNESQRAEGTTAIISRWFFPLLLTWIHSLSHRTTRSILPHLPTHASITPQGRGICGQYFPLSPPFKVCLPRPCSDSWSFRKPCRKFFPFAKHPVARHHMMERASLIYYCLSPEIFYFLGHSASSRRARVGIRKHPMHPRCLIHWPCLFFSHSVADTQILNGKPQGSVRFMVRWGWWSLPGFSSLLSCLETTVPWSSIQYPREVFSHL